MNPAMGPGERCKLPSVGMDFFMHFS